MPYGDHPPRRFDFGKPAVVQQPFTHAGVAYKHGDSFPYEKLGLGKLQVYGFWLTSRVDFRAAIAAEQPRELSRAERRARR
jgi:hypothetical protein